MGSTAPYTVGHAIESLPTLTVRNKYSSSAPVTPCIVSVKDAMPRSDVLT